MNVLWELGIEPDLQMLPLPAGGFGAVPDREAAIRRGLDNLRTAQWAYWPMTTELETHTRQLLASEFDTLFVQTDDGYAPTWLSLGREVLITWEPRR
jgi:hypothetical protein